jgi:polar amino acid transport system permease protein
MRTLAPGDISFILFAANWTIVLSLIAFAGGAVLGALITAVRLLGGIPAILITGVVQIGQGVPLIVQLFLAYFGLAVIGYDPAPLFAATLAFSFWTGVFLSDIWFGSVKSIPRQQWDGAVSLALSWSQQMRFVIVPQATRIAIPPTVGFLVQVIKNTSLASVIGFVELVRAGQMVNNATFRSFAVFGLICVVYFAICFPLSWVSRRLEGRLHVSS